MDQVYRQCTSMRLRLVGAFVPWTSGFKPTGTQKFNAGWEDVYRTNPQQKTLYLTLLRVRCETRARSRATIPRVVLGWTASVGPAPSQCLHPVYRKGEVSKQFESHAQSPSDMPDQGASLYPSQMPIPGSYGDEQDSFTGLQRPHGRTEDVRAQ